MLKKFHDHHKTLSSRSVGNVLFRDYLTEIMTCDKDDCKLCRAFGDGLCMPMTDDGCLRDVLLHPVDCPVNDNNINAYLIGW